MTNSTKSTTRSNSVVGLLDRTVASTARTVRAVVLLVGASMAAAAAPEALILLTLLR